MKQSLKVTRRVSTHLHGCPQQSHIRDLLCMWGASWWLGSVGSDWQLESGRWWTKVSESKKVGHSPMQDWKGNVRDGTRAGEM
jgi:hypothetical protein